ncbi:MAG: hypothetical protein V3U31_07670 [Dehalococcoidia bacterium]
MRRLTPVLAALVIVALLHTVGPAPVYAQTWESYRNTPRSIVWGTPPDYYDSTYNVVYMGGAGFIQNQTYNIGYYDGSGNLIATDSSVKATGGAGNLKSQYSLGTDQGAAAGTWHSTVYQDPATPPVTWDGLGVADDQFDVVAAAIPEFPTVLSAIAVAAISFAIYDWLRKRRLAGVSV